MWKYFMSYHIIYENEDVGIGNNVSETSGRIHSWECIESIAYSIKNQLLAINPDRKIRTIVIINFIELPIELQEFILKPVNQPYLEIAQKLSRMSVDKMRDVAEGLLDITL